MWAGRLLRAWRGAFKPGSCRKLWAAAGGSLLLVGLQSCRHAPAACLREGGLFLDPEEDNLTEAHPIEMNEAAALTHSCLLRQASGAAVDSGMQLLHRTVRAILDFSCQHRKQLQEVIELLEYCTTMLRHPEEHDKLWEMLVAARSKADSLKQQLNDLKLLMTYACATLENTAMAAYISGSEFSASVATQITDSAKLELSTDAKLTETLEMQYLEVHTRYIEAAQKAVEQANTDDNDDDDGEKSIESVVQDNGNEVKIEIDDR